MGEPVPYVLTDRARVLAANVRIDELEHMLRHFDRASMHLLHYVRAVEGLPDAEQWSLVIEQVEDMVNPYGSRNPYR